MSGSMLRGAPQLEGTESQSAGDVSEGFGHGVRERHVQNEIGVEKLISVMTGTHSNRLLQQ